MLKVLHALVLAALLGASPAKADNWGCEVLLCMSNPAGPTAVGACVPPITRLWKHLAKGRPFPTCDMGAGGAGTGATHRYADGNLCPPMYRVYEDQQVSCQYSGVIDVYLSGKQQARVWWQPGGSVSEPIPGSNVPGSPKFIADQAAYLKAQEAARLGALGAQGDQQ